MKALMDEYDGMGSLLHKMLVAFDFQMVFSNPEKKWVIRSVK